MMSDLTKLHNEYARYVYLNLDYGLDGEGTTIQVKMDDEGIVVDVFSADVGFGELVGTTRKAYADFGAKFNPFTGEREFEDE